MNHLNIVEELVHSLTENGFSWDIGKVIVGNDKIEVQIQRANWIDIYHIKVAEDGKITADYLTVKHNGDGSVVWADKKFDTVDAIAKEISEYY